MRVGARRDLWGVCDCQYLHSARQAREALADRIGDRAADAGIDLIENECRRRAAIGDDDLKSEHEAREFAAGGDFHQGTRTRAWICLHAEFQLVITVG